MKSFQIKKCLTVVASLALLAGAAAVHADSETGQVKLITLATGAAENDGFGVVMKTPSPTGTGRCTSVGEPILWVQLNGEGSQRLHASLVAAVAEGKSVTLSYNYDSDEHACTLQAATIE